MRTLLIIAGILLVLAVNFVLYCCCLLYTSYVDGNSQRTKDITFNADALQTITMKLPAGVQLHNLTTGKTSKAGESVEICGGTKFYLSAPLTQVSDVAGSWSATMKGSITKDYSAYKISTCLLYTSRCV